MNKDLTTVILYVAQLKLFIDAQVPEADTMLEEFISACVEARENTIRLTNLWNDTILALQDHDMSEALVCISKISSGEKDESE